MYNCAVCKSLFNNKHSYEQHTNDSSVHIKRTFHCVKCERTFKNSSALAQHVEASSCIRLSHQRLLNGVRAAERVTGHTSYLTKSLLTNNNSDDNAKSTIYATKKSWNGHAFECSLCHKLFSKLQSLNQHLQSPPHMSKEYRCPNRSCGKEFTTLSGVVRHLEDGKCGGVKIEAIQRATHNLIDRFSNLLKL